MHVSLFIHTNKEGESGRSPTSPAERPEMVIVKGARPCTLVPKIQEFPCHRSKTDVLKAMEAFRMIQTAFIESPVSIRGDFEVGEVGMSSRSMTASWNVLRTVQDSQRSPGCPGDWKTWLKTLEDEGGIVDIQIELKAP